jgi:hypothetical protein
MTGRQVVPSPWQKLPQGGPMNVAADNQQVRGSIPRPGSDSKTRPDQAKLRSGADVA